MTPLITLSELFSTVELAKQFALYKRFKQAIRDGELSAVPTPGTVAIHRQKSPLAVPEHLMPETAKTWLHKTITEMNQPKSTSRRLSVSKADLDSGKVSFEEAAAKYRASLQPKSKLKRRRKEAKPASE